MPPLHRHEWPTYITSWALKGIFVGGCVARGDGSSFRAKAHAHTTGAYTGWLCFRTRRRVASRALVLHELAHLVTGQGHTNAWRRTVLRLGGTLDAIPGLLRSYQARGARDDNDAM